MRVEKKNEDRQTEDSRYYTILTHNKRENKIYVAWNFGEEEEEENIFSEVSPELGLFMQTHAYPNR